LPPRLASEVRTPLREALERKGLSQAALARALGCDRRQAGAWVTGEYTPVPERREEIAAIVGSTSVELWPDADDSSAAAA
jgi:transcriptional regulator with XRE-family HTH domain